MLSVNAHTHVCSEHFVEANGRLLRPDEVPSLYLPAPITSLMKRNLRKEPKQRPFVSSDCESNSSWIDDEPEKDLTDACTQTEKTLIDDEIVVIEKVAALEKEVRCKDQQPLQQKFQLMNIKDDDNQVLFYTGFQSYGALEAFYDFLGPAAETLCYKRSIWSSKNITTY